MTDETAILKNHYINKISISDYNLLQTIGTGAYGKVRLTRNKKTGRTYALKILKKADIIRMKQVDHVFNEYIIISQIYHPFIVEFRGASLIDPVYLYLLTEFIPGGELFTLLKSKEYFPIEQAKFYAAHIVTIFEYLHKKKIVYRDLKPENILINFNGYLKLTDFGFAKIIDKEMTYTLCGTPEYIAPEIIANKGHNFPVDWWTLGIFLYEMIVGVVPFMDNDPLNLYQQILKCKVKFPKNINKEARSLIKHLLVVDTSRRYGCLKNGIRDIIEHKFFNGFDWKSLLFKTMKAPFVPDVKNCIYSSNFNYYPDSEDDNQIALPDDKDPFINW